MAKQGKHEDTKVHKDYFYKIKSVLIRAIRGKKVGGGKDKIRVQLNMNLLIRVHSNLNKCL